MSKCRAVLGTAFAGGRGERGGRFAAGLRKRSGAECSVGWHGRPNGKRWLSGKAASGTLEGAEPKVLLFVCASLLLCKIDNPQNCIEHFMISFFIPKFFILVTASPFYAARRDKNGVRNVVRLPVLSCRCEGRQSAASEAKLLAALPRSFAAASGLLLKTKAFLYSRALFFPCCQFSDKALCTFWSRSGSLHGAACSVLAEQRRNEASSSRAGGRRHAGRRYRLATSGLQAAEYSSDG